MPLNYITPKIKRGAQKSLEIGAEMRTNKKIMILVGGGREAPYNLIINCSDEYYFLIISYIHHNYHNI